MYVLGSTLNAGRAGNTGVASPDSVMVADEAVDSVMTLLPAAVTSTLTCTSNASTNVSVCTSAPKVYVANALPIM